MNKITKHIFLIVAVMLIILIIISIIITNNNNNNNKPINKYKKETKEIATEYLNKNIDNNYAYKKMDTLKNKVKQEYENNNIYEYQSLYFKISNITTYLIIDDYLKVKELIKDL